MNKTHKNPFTQYSLTEETDLKQDKCENTEYGGQRAAPGRKLNGRRKVMCVVVNFRSSGQEALTETMAFQERSEEVGKQVMWIFVGRAF